MTDVPMMQIGGVLKDTMDVAAEAVSKVAQCSGDPKVAIEALRTLARLAETKNVTVQNCTFTGSPDSNGSGIGVVGSSAPMFGDRDFR